MQADDTAPWAGRQGGMLLGTGGYAYAKAQPFSPPFSNIGAS